MEYVVIERNCDSGKESPWYVWGTTEETTCMFSSLGWGVLNADSRIVERLAEQKKRIEALMKRSLIS